MANTILKKIRMPNTVTSYEVGEWYGVCTTAASTQTKVVSISGFDSNSLINGVRVTVQFNNNQTYNGTPYLNVSSTGAKPIKINGNNVAVKYEWRSGAIISFIYSNQQWVIDNGDHASTSYWGKTILYDAEDYTDDKAITPNAVTRVVGNISEFWMWDGADYESITLVDTTTPDTANWQIDDDYAGCNFTFTDISETLIDYNRKPALLKVTFGDYVRYAYIRYRQESFYFAMVGGNTFSVELYASGVNLYTTPSNAGAKPFKIELFAGGGANIVTYAMLKEQGYLTLSDLPIYDGTVE